MTVAEMHSFQIVDEVGDAASPFGEWEPYEEDHCFLFDMYESRKISDSIVIIQKVNIDESTGTKTYFIYHPVNERKYDRVSIDNLRPCRMMYISTPKKANADCEIRYKYK